MKNKVLILKNEISPYNVPVYNVLSSFYDVTVGYYSADKSRADSSFKKLCLKFLKLGPFVIIKHLRKTAKNFDVVIFAPDPHVISYYILPFFIHSYKIISWGIGFRCSYNHPYNTSRSLGFVDWMNKMVYNKCDANIFYMNKAKEFWLKTNLDFSKVFIAPNTAEVMAIELTPEKKLNYLFIGTLYKGKGVELLLKSYKDAYSEEPNIGRLIIIGAGDMEHTLKQYVSDYDLAEKVSFVGAIYDEVLIAKYFSEGLLCISPTQAGLSCPKSMGYGVPFVCRFDAITGGEIYHIENGINGVIYSNDSELKDIILDSYRNRDYYVQMGIKSKEYYYKYATVKHMASGVISAIRYCINYTD